MGLDPLITEAKRRMRRRRFVAAWLVIVIALATAGAFALGAGHGPGSGGTLSAGQTRTFGTARTGDQVTCRADGHSVTVAVPSPSEGAFKQTTVTPTRRLAINVGRKVDGRVWALCRWR
jgi:hypothetical protein